MTVADIGNSEDDYHRVLRSRARKVSDLLQRSDTVKRLAIASCMIGGIEKVMLLD